MLTGAMAPTSGTAYVAGKDIRTDMPEIRRDVGVCLQHDCLFPKLTVREHVEFFSRLKGLYSNVSRGEADKHVDQAIEDVALAEKQNTLSQNLSGGMKRKLSVAIAFCGGSKIVVLDEPTSGMDPYSRRFTWNVIRHYRQDRCIILTTHFMDEADILGDRIAIMAEGKLRCVGSSLFLKKMYGVGYQLTIEKKQMNGHESNKTVHQITSEYDEAIDVELGPPDDETDQLVAVDQAAGGIYNTHTKTDKLKQIVVNSVKGAKLLSDVGSELSFQLPLDSSSQFIPMLERLDKEVENGSIICYGVSITTLDEVFLMVTGEVLPGKAELASSKVGDESSRYPDATVNKSLTQPAMMLDDEGLFWRHLGILLKKRAAIFRRDKKAWLLTTILPTFFVLLGFLLSLRLSPNRNLHPVTMDLNDYNGKVKDPLQNPIVVNSPHNPFLCQPGICSHKPPTPGIVTEDLTNETYFFCGLQAKLGLDLASESYTPSNLTCSISDSVNIIGAVTQAGALPVEVDVGNISEVSRSTRHILKKPTVDVCILMLFCHSRWTVVDEFIAVIGCLCSVALWSNLVHARGQQ